MNPPNDEHYHSIHSRVAIYGRLLLIESKNWIKASESLNPENIIKMIYSAGEKSTGDGIPPYDATIGQIHGRDIISRFRSVVARSSHVFQRSSKEEEDTFFGDMGNGVATGIMHTSFDISHCPQEKVKCHDAACEELTCHNDTTTTYTVNNSMGGHSREHLAPFARTQHLESQLNSTNIETSHDTVATAAITESSISNRLLESDETQLSERKCTFKELDQYNTDGTVASSVTQNIDDKDHASSELRNSAPLPEMVAKICMEIFFLDKAVHKNLTDPK
jgi:hypothetical protein